MKLNTLRCDVFSLNKLEDHPLLETLSQHISLTDLDCSRDFVRCFPCEFQSNSQGTLDMRFPSIDLQCFKVCYFQMAGENCVETRMRREDNFLSSLDLEWFWSLQNTDDFPKKTAVMIHSKQCLAGAEGLAFVFVGHGNVWFMFHTYWITSKCFWYKWESSFIRFRFLHLHWPTLSLKSSDSRHFDGISNEEKDLKKKQYKQCVE